MNFAHKSLRWPVHWSIRASGPGPMAHTVREPSATCVWPASSTMHVSNPQSLAAFSISTSSSSLFTCICKCIILAFWLLFISCDCTQTWFSSWWIQPALLLTMFACKLVSVNKKQLKRMVMGTLPSGKFWWSQTPPTSIAIQVPPEDHASQHLSDCGLCERNLWWGSGAEPGLPHGVSLRIA